MDEILLKLRAFYSPKGFEIHPFKVKWYNDEVDHHFQFDLHPDTLAVLVISTPAMFEKAFVPYICSDDCQGSLDLLDKCMKHHFSFVNKLLPLEDIEIIHDFELTGTRRPKILVQPAAHVSGAAYYYTSRCLDPNPFKQKIFGVCIHPDYGGWFALRGVFIFKSVLCPDLSRLKPFDCVSDQSKKVELLDLFNNHWRDARYRDIIPVKLKYSEDQKKYFDTLPKDRAPLVNELKEKYMQKSDLI
ncbi:methylmalonic aciduria and homocystinuria type C protein [Biomphalaria pfeifferi]|uniref:Cyanocobalamin reductase (cyanide-eliminating) n=1 Tax=Biomphalaria pfeifferi TaxID=112525 RepID=A0AAD8AUX8_BIOPF|nr:methylmalonic aciduria and homocystinuria type C protein [Biomphalaria pfeifferi]